MKTKLQNFTAIAFMAAVLITGIYLIRDTLDYISASKYSIPVGIAFVALALNIAARRIE